MANKRFALLSDASDVPVDDVLGDPDVLSVVAQHLDAAHSLRAAAVVSCEFRTAVCLERTRRLNLPHTKWVFIGGGIPTYQYSSPYPFRRIDAVGVHDTLLPALPEPLNEVSAAVLSTGEIVVTGNHDRKPASVYIFTPSHWSWRRVDAPSVECVATLVPCEDGGFAAVGGFNGKWNSTRLCVYSPSATGYEETVSELPDACTDPVVYTRNEETMLTAFLDDTDDRTSTQVFFPHESAGVLNDLPPFDSMWVVGGGWLTPCGHDVAIMLRPCNEALDVFASKPHGSWRKVAHFPPAVIGGEQVFFSCCETPQLAVCKFDDIDHLVLSYRFWKNDEDSLGLWIGAPLRDVLAQMDVPEHEREGVALRDVTHLLHTPVRKEAALISIPSY